MLNRIIVFIWMGCLALYANDPFEVTSVKGEVLLRGQNDLKIRPLRLGDQVLQEDRIRLSDGSELILENKQGTKIKVKDKSYLRLASLLSNQNNLNVELQLFKGKARSIVQDLEPGEKFHVITPTTKVIVRGTDFDTESKSLNESSVGVNEGLVGVQTNVGLTQLKQGDTASTGDGSLKVNQQNTQSQSQNGDEDTSSQPNGSQTLNKTEDIQQEQAQQNLAERLFNLKIQVRDRDR